MLQLPARLALNHVLAQSGWAQRRMAGYAGRTARLAMTPWRLEFLVTPDGLVAAPAPGTQAFDVEIELPADTPLRVLQGQEQVMREARISGTADFADALGFVFGRLRWDLEEDLAKLVGDIAAHRLVVLFTAFVGWQQRAARNLAENFGEYLTHENPVLVGPDELREFAASVARFDGELARLERRLRELSRP